MNPAAELVHHSPGRLRLRIRDARRNPDFLERVRQALWPIDGVRGVDISPATGSVLVRYAGDEELMEPAVAQCGREEGLFDLRTSAPEPPTELSQTFRNAAHQVNEVLRASTSGSADLRELFPIAVALYAFFKVDRTRGAPLWLSMLFFSFSAYQELHDDEPWRETRDEIRALGHEITRLKEALERHALQPAS